MTERIIAAAVQIECVTISLPQPARHGQVLHCLETMGIPEHYVHTAVQGFLTSAGRFVNRIQAMQIAHIAGQVPNGTTDQRDLFGEDVW